MTDATPTIDRTDELLCDRALFGLDTAEEAELVRLLGHAVPDDEDTLRAAAAVDLATLGALEPLPAGLAARLRADADRVFAPVVAPPRAPDSLPKKRRASALIPWALAAAFGVLAVVGWLDRFREPRQVGPLASTAPPVSTSTASTAPLPSVVPPPSPSQQRAELLAKRPDAKRVPWSATKDPGAAGASGDVVWSSEAQEGYMTFRGLRANDPKATQYQLWIFDAERDDKYPVDGGVFDVPPAGGEVVVPIRAKIRAGKAKLFAITVEPPGGVVVSKREHIVLTAAP